MFLDDSLNISVEEGRVRLRVCLLSFNFTLYQRQVHLALLFPVTKGGGGGKKLGIFL